VTYHMEYDDHICVEISFIDAECSTMTLAFLSETGYSEGECVSRTSECPYEWYLSQVSIQQMWASACTNGGDSVTVSMKCAGSESTTTTTTTTTPAMTTTAESTTASTSQPQSTQAPVQVRTQMKFAGVTTDNFDGMKNDLKKVIAEKVNLEPEKVDLRLVNAAQRRRLNEATVEATFEVEDETASDSLINTISAPTFSDDLNTAIQEEAAGNANHPLAAVSVTEVSEPVRVIPPTESDSDEDSNTVAIVAGVLGGVVGLALCVAVIYFIMNKDSDGEKKIEETSNKKVELAENNKREPKTTGEGELATGGGEV